MHIFKKILLIFLIVVYQLFFSFAFLVVADELFNNLLDDKDWVGIFLIFVIVGGIAFGLIMFIRLVAKKINGFNPSIKRKEFFLQHLLGAVIIAYLVLATFIPKFPYIFGSAFNKELFVSKYYFIFGAIPLLAEFIAAFYVPYCRGCGYIGERTHIVVGHDIEDECEYTTNEIVEHKKVGEEITTTTYYDEDGYVDHKDVETKDITEPVYGEVRHYSGFHKTIYKCDYCDCEDYSGKYISF